MESGSASPTPKVTSSTSSSDKSVERTSSQSALLAALLATGALAAGCSGSQYETEPRSDTASGVEVVGLEVDDLTVDLPRPTLVTCQEDDRDNIHFAWTGSNVLVPRHPWDEDQGGSQIRLNFAADPPVPATASLQIYLHGELRELSWSDGRRGGQPPATLTLSGVRAYTFVGTLADYAPASASTHTVRIEFFC